MAVTDVYNINKEKVGEHDLNDKIFGVKVDKHLLHDVVRMQLAKRRQGNACTKTRAQVRGSNAKPWRQKGTGRARAGSRRSPVWRGGGAAFGPKPRDYSYKIPKKVRKTGLKMALSARFSEDNLLVLDDFQLDEIKTKSFKSVMNRLEISNALILIPEGDEKLEKSSRNIPQFRVMSLAGMNVYDILLHKKIIILQTCLGQIEVRLGA